MIKESWVLVTEKSKQSQIIRISAKCENPDTGTHHGKTREDWGVQVSSCTVSI
jgi:hypothetical protein